jgi:ketosteroid isomerase-like protein
MKKIVIILVGIVFVMACERSVNTKGSKDVLLETDREFSRQSVEKGSTEAFSSFMADDAVIFPQKGHPIEGKETYVQLYNQNQEEQQESQLEWEPYFADIAASGDLGYTLGKYILTTEDPVGEKQVKYGYYVTIWKKQADGNWKFVFDAGNESSNPNKK